MRHLESIQKSRIDFLLNTIVDNEKRRMLNSPTLSLLDKVEQGRSARADDLIGGYSYTSQFWDQQKIAQVAKEYCRSMGNTTTPSYEDLEELLIVPKERGEHQVRTANGVWELKPSSGKAQKEENEFFSERTARCLALQNASDTLMSAINPQDEDIHLAKQYKERIHGDVGGSWVIRAQMESVTDEPEAAMTTGDPHTSLETQTKQEIFSPRAEHLQAGSSKLCPSALETHHPMPPLEKKEFTPLQNVKGRGKVVNPFARESSCQTSEPPRITEVPPQQPAVQQTVHVPPPVMVETVPQAAGFTPPVFTAAPRQYVHLTGRNVNSIPAIPHRTPGQVMNDYHPIISMCQESVRVPAEQYWRSGTREYRPYVAEPTYDYSNCASTYRGYGVAGAPGGPPGGPPYGGVMQMGGISDGNSERERGSRNGSFRGGSGGGGPRGLGGPGGPGSPGGPPDNPDDWGSNHDAYWHLANGWVAIRGPRGERGELGPAG
ncbi:hypothetical protein GYMLUDRAFT_239453 [Collybiopsis luxurians FD-317 M1]|nr:hypothetical protein GYMLUDRAFT_239453 [Collybiopsis luxurians FD-317 M1]